MYTGNFKKNEQFADPSEMRESDTSRVILKYSLGNLGDKNIDVISAYRSRKFG